MAGLATDVRCVGATRRVAARAARLRGDGILSDAEHCGDLPERAPRRAQPADPLAAFKGEHGRAPEPGTAATRRSEPLLASARRSACARYSAKAPRIAKNSRPAGVLVSSPSSSEIKSTRRASSSPVRVSRWVRERPSRSSLTTSTASKRRRRASARSRSSAGRRAFAPLDAMVDVLFRHLEASGGGVGLQGLELDVGALVGRGDAGVEGDAGRHGVTSSPRILDGNDFGCIPFSWGLEWRT